MQMPTDQLDRVLDKLDNIDTKLGEFRDEMHDFRQNAESRLAVLEERCSKEKLEAQDKRLSDLEKFQSKAGVYMAIAATLGGTAVGLVLKLVPHA